MGRTEAICVALLLVLSGCVAPISSPSGFDDGDLGEVNGYAADDRLEIDAERGLTETELAAVAYRAMARLEVLRGLEFREDVEIEVISREEYRSQRAGSGERESADAFTNEVWRAAFVVDEETDVNAAFDDLYADSVQGYYYDGRIVIVADDPENARVSRTTLVHELVHALQAQHFGLDRHGDSIDERRAEQGVIEGEANYLPRLYDRRCEAGWECLPEPSAEESREVQPADGRLNVGLFLSIFVPYAEGAAFVEHLHEDGDWAVVDAAHERRPVSTEQVIHPERYPDVEPIDVEPADRSSEEWEPIVDDDGDVRTETIGEATLFATLWNAGVIERPLGEGAGEYSPYNYSHPITDGWAGDTVIAYEDDDDRTGHVWQTAWKSAADAEAFREAYVDLLESHGAESVDDGVYLIGDAPFAGAYRVELDDERVTIVRAPSIGDLEEIRPTRTASTDVATPAATIAPSVAATSASTLGPSVAATPASILPAPGADATPIDRPTAPKSGSLADASPTPPAYG